MPQSIPSGLLRDHVLQALAALDGGVAHPFGTATGYELVHGGRRYAPKAVVGLACVHLLGRVLSPEEFSGGEAPGQANFVLRRLGFDVARKGGEAAPEAAAGKDWSELEIALIIADYFAMLEKELLGRPYSKTEHRQALAKCLSGRTEASIEFKHANISAVLAGLGLPYIDGYKPRGNFQALLAQGVDVFLDARPGFLEGLAGSPVVDPAEAPALGAIDLEAVIEGPPEDTASPGTAAKPWLSRKGQRIDFALRDALNRRLGSMGEEFVVRLERQRLLAAGRDDLAGRVLWAAQEFGDGLGFDVLSFDDQDGSEKLIEVKTTGLGKEHPFYVTATEVRCSEDVGERYHLFRVFDFARSPKAYILAGPISAAFRLEPTQYRATR